MWNYLPLIIIAALVVIVLLFWIFGSKSGSIPITPSESAEPPKAVPAPLPVAPKVAPTKTPAKTVKPAAQKPVAPKTATPKAAASKPAVAKVATPKAAPKPQAAAKPALPDNLEWLKGVGPKVNTLLKSLGITSFNQIANWTPADITEIDAKLGVFAGRIDRDNWVDQAKLLVAGDVAGFEQKYGALGSETKG